MNRRSALAIRYPVTARAAAISAALLLLPLLVGCSLFEPRQPQRSSPPASSEPVAGEPEEGLPVEPSPPTPATSESDLDDMLQADGLLALGDAELASGELRAAAETYLRLVETHPQSDEAPQALFQLAAMQLNPASPIYSTNDGVATLERIGDEHADSVWAPAAAVVLQLARQNADLEQALETLEAQLDELKKLDLDSDG